MASPQKISSKVEGIKTKIAKKVQTKNTLGINVNKKSPISESPNTIKLQKFIIEYKNDDEIDEKEQSKSSNSQESTLQKVKKKSAESGATTGISINEKSNAIKSKEDGKERKIPPDSKELPSARALLKAIPRMPPDYQMVMAPDGPFAQFSQITKHIYLTGLGGMTRDNIVKHQITCIINATYEMPNITKEGIEAIRVPAEDAVHDDLGSYLEPIADKLHLVGQKNGKVVVHCVAGVSRSATLVIAYLIKHNGMNLREAFNHVRARRVVARPNNGFFRQLITFEYKILETNSTKLIELRYRINSQQVLVLVPDFFPTDHPNQLEREARKIYNCKMQSQGDYESQK